MEHLVNADDISGTLDVVSNSTVKAWSLGVNIFDNQPVPPPLAKAETVEQLASKKESPPPVFPHVYLAIDTRITSIMLQDSVKQGLSALNVPYTDFGLLTTP